MKTSDASQGFKCATVACAPAATFTISEIYETEQKHAYAQLCNSDEKECVCIFLQTQSFGYEQCPNNPSTMHLLLG